MTEADEAVRNSSVSSYSVGNTSENSTLILRIVKLEERVSKLELQSQVEDHHGAKNCDSIADEMIFRKSNATIIVGLTSIASTCSTLKNLICTSKLARIQCIWLLLVLMGFTWYASLGFAEAYENENSRYKPQRIVASKDYEVLEDGKYSMPYFYIEFRVIELRSNFSDLDCSADNFADCTVERNWTNQEIMETFSAMWGVNTTWECDDGCVGSIELNQLTDKMELGCEYTTVPKEGEPLNISEVVFGAVDPSHADFENMFMGYIGFKPEDPQPGNLWQCSLKFDPIQIAEKKLYVDTYMLRIHHDNNANFFSQDVSSIQMELENLLSEDDTKNKFQVFYEESVLELYHLSIPYLSEVSKFNYAYEVEVEEEEYDLSTNLTHISVAPEMPVIEYEEYLEYSYVNWLSGMGGMLSMLALWYFWIAAVLINWFGENEWDMGILPMMSHVFINREILYWMKAQLTGTHVLDRP